MCYIIEQLVFQELEKWQSQVSQLFRSEMMMMMMHCDDDDDDDDDDVV